MLPPSLSTDHGSEFDERLDEIIADYLDRLNAGEMLDRDEIRREHPEYAREVIERLEVFQTVGLASEAQAVPLGNLGDYTLRRQIGRGGMGAVYEAWENSMDRRVALKVLPTGIAADTRASARFLREAQTAGKLNHANIVRVYSTGVREGIPWYSMEYVEGETLAQVLARIKDAESETETPFGKKDSVVYFSKLAETFADVADGLQHAHTRKVIHRDIKPSNLILDREGRLRILDFGLARLEGQDSITISGDLVGTPQYMSPEQARRKQIPVDHRTDVYSFGATMYEALTGRPPFRGKDHADTLSQIIERDPVEPRKVLSRVPKDLETIVLKCLRKEAADRYGTAEALGQDLRRFVRGDPVEARPEGRSERLLRLLRRHRRTAVWAALAMTLTVALGIVTLLREGEREAARRYGAIQYERQLVAAALKMVRGDLIRPWADGRAPVTPFGLPVPRRLVKLVEERARQAVTQALAETEVAIEAVPGRFEGYYLRGRLLAWLGRGEESREALAACLARKPGFLPAEVLAAELNTHAGAERSNASQVESDAWGAAWLRVHDSIGRQRWAEACLAYDALVDIEEGAARAYPGSNIETLLGRGIARLNSQDVEGAKRDFWSARALVLDHWGELLEPSLLLAKAYHAEGDRESRRQTFEELWSRAQDRDEASLWIALTCSSLKLDEDGLFWARRMGDWTVRPLLESHLQTVLGDFEAAIAVRRTLWSTLPQDLDLWLEHGQDLRRRAWVQMGDIGRMAAVGERLFFTVGARVQGWDLWVSDGTETGTYKIKEVSPDPVNFGPEEFTAVGDRLFFIAAHGVRGELWVSDGTAQGTHMVKNTAAGELTAVGDRVFFTASAALWVSDGTDEGTTLLVQNFVESFGGNALLGESRGLLYFMKLRFIDAAATGEIWVTDGSQAGTKPILDGSSQPMLSLCYSNRIPNPPALWKEKGLIVFTGDDGSTGAEPWVLPLDQRKFHRGDPNSSGEVDISDAIAIFSHLFLGDPAALSCRESADSDNDGTIDISDGIFLLSWLFTGGPEPVVPGPTDRPCDVDPDPAASPGYLGCVEYQPCQ